MSESCSERSVCGKLGLFQQKRCCVVSHRVCALEVQSVIGDEHFPFERSIERAHVDEVFICEKMDRWSNTDMHILFLLWYLNEVEY